MFRSCVYSFAPPRRNLASTAPENGRLWPVWAALTTRRRGMGQKYGPKPARATWRLSRFAAMETTMKRAGEPVGYVRVSTADQQVAAQSDALTATGCVRVFTETASGASL
ncbi:recombinase family protein [Citricoccus sp. GCM10030269]|uniref:recombinase family protein n=1 Tax=Citricoccus sp. GCM10030269 TaxID=3273388 RepID=UPI00361583F0